MKRLSVVATFILLASATGCAQQTPGATPAVSRPDGTSAASVISYYRTQQGVAREVVVRNLQFLPATIEVPVGTTVTWNNQDTVPHNVTHPLPGQSATMGASAGSLPVGGSYSITFNSPGVFEYYCSIHPSMRGTVRVVR
ncbi:cupredoxin domain-containing protein [bacterium]|nr:cupredoxin domain-containing protein [bacterium]